jgi:ABC-2 type transport system ATP-binding protein
VWAHPARAKRLIGVVPQTNTLDRALSVRDNLFFHGRFFGMSSARARAEADDMLERFKLTERATMPVRALSGGMAQRLMVARADARALGVPERADHRTRSAEPHRVGHPQRPPRRGADDPPHDPLMEEAGALQALAIIDHGVSGRADRGQLQRSIGIDTSVTVTASGDLEALADVLEREIGGATAIVMDHTVRLGVKGAEGVLPAVVQAAERAGFDVTDLSITEPTLETVFINLTGKDLRE